MRNPTAPLILALPMPTVWVTVSGMITEQAAVLPTMVFMTAASPGLAGVTVNLYRDSDNNGTPDGAVITTTTTGANGYYRFDRLGPDTYIVEVVMPTGYQVSASYLLSVILTTEQTDRDNNGVVPGTGVIRSNPVTLGGGSEPTGDDDPATNPLTGEAPDAYSNRTVDFGLYAAPLSLGDLVWVDDGARWWNGK